MRLSTLVEQLSLKRINNKWCVIDATGKVVARRGNKTAAALQLSKLIAPTDKTLDFPTYKQAEAWMEQQVDDPYVDNYRFAYLDDPAGMSKYNEIESKGCCGCFDEEITILGRPAKIGCNFGH
jgi:hypothetical protein